MVLGCLLAFVIDMLKRRASKRFVLAESGQDDVWDSSVDNIPNITVDRNANNSNMNTEATTTTTTTTVTMTATPSTSSASTQTTSNNHLTVPKTTTVELNQGLK